MYQKINSVIKQHLHFCHFLSYFPEILTDKVTTTKGKEVNQSFSTFSGQFAKHNASVQIPHNPCSSYNLFPQTSKTQQPKIDATDRRQIEAQNEDKSHTTKETLDDIKRIHYKEKKKKEKNGAEQYQAATTSQGWVSHY